MKKFGGFPERMEFTPLPNVFLSRLLPEITDMAELKVTLNIMARLYRKRGYPRYITPGELLEDAALASGLKDGEKPPEAELRRGLQLAADRGTLLNLKMEKGGQTQDLYFLNDKQGREAAAKLENGEIEIAGLKPGAPPIEAEALPDIFTLYEENVGMLTPMVADELADAEKLYPEEWIKDAIREAALHNKRNIRYIARILERWKAEGRTDGTHRGHSEKSGPDKYFKGKYGHMVQR